MHASCVAPGLLHELSEVQGPLLVVLMTSLLTCSVKLRNTDTPVEPGLELLPFKHIG
jgi:hypothetical protein